MHKLIHGIWLVMASGLAQAVSADYTVRFDLETEALYVRACFAPGPRLSLKAQDRQAHGYLTFARYADDSPVSLRQRRMTLRQSTEQRCVRYGVNIAALASERRLSKAYRLGQDWLISSDVWFWRPREAFVDSAIRFDLPDNYAVSAPWPPLAQGQAHSYRLDQGPSDWDHLIALGPFQPTRLSIGQAELHLAVLQGDSGRLDQNTIKHWVEATAGAIAQIYGRLPLPTAQVLVVPIGRGNEPVPWAQVRRGGGSAVHLFINENYRAEDFMADWTAAHEFSHLFHPYFGASGRWLAEGLASYYQNVTRARAGLLNEQAAWQALLDGFARGQRNSTGLTLRQANRRMRQEGKYMRVYWSGAAIALLGDIELRRLSGGVASLDSVLAQFGACHLPSRQMWRAEDFLRRLDELAGHTVFMPLYRRYADSTRFPNVESAYEHLGLRLRNGKVRLAGTPQQVAARESIMAKPSFSLASCTSHSTHAG